MAVRALFRQEFDRFASAQSAALADLTHRAVEWFAEDAGVIFGAIAHHESDLNWSFIVLGRNDQDQFHTLYLDFGFWNCDEARRMLLAKMESLADGEPVLAPRSAESVEHPRTAVRSAFNRHDV
jgi:hypothetical protein